MNLIDAALRRQKLTVVSFATFDKLPRALEASDTRGPSPAMQHLILGAQQPKLVSATQEAIS
jgi:hypothetical protein